MRARFLNEMSISSIKLEDVVNKKMIDEWLLDDFTEEILLYSYAEEHGLDPDILIKNDFIESVEFKKWGLYELELKFYEIQNKFNYEIIEEDMIPIWRMISAKKHWLYHLENEGKRLGIYWTWDKAAAEPHWGYDSNISKFLIESEVHAKHINWIQTIKANMHPSYEEEKEITLYKNTPLNIISIEKDGGELDISNIKNKIFKT